MRSGSRWKARKSYPDATGWANGVRPTHQVTNSPTHGGSRMLDLANLGALGDQAWVLEDLDEEDAGEEAAYVRPHRDTPRHVRPHPRDLRQAGEHLEEEPP